MNSPSTESSLLSLSQLAAMVAARRTLIIATVVVMVGATAAITASLPRQWTASSDIYVDYRENDPINGRNFSAMLDDSYMQTQIDMIKSQVVAQQVVDSLNLTQSAQYKEAVQKLGEARAHDLLIDNLNKNTDVINKRGSRVLEVAYTAATPEMARDYSAAVVNAFIGMTQQIASRAARSRTEQYSAQLEQLRKEADAIQENITRYQRETGLLKATDNDDIDTRRLNQLSLQLADVRAQQQAAQARSEATRQLVQRGIRPDEIPEVGQFGPIQELRGKLNDVERRLTEAQATLGDRHPTVIGLVAERQELRTRLERSSRAAMDSQGGDTARLSMQEAALNRDIEAQRDRVLKQMQGRDRLLSYERQLASVQQIYNAALQKYDGLLMASNITLPNLAVLRAAELPSAPSGPKVRRNLISGLLVGVAAGLFMALMLELFNRRVRTRDDLLKGLPLPLIGTIGRRGALA